MPEFLYGINWFSMKYFSIIESLMLPYEHQFNWFLKTEFASFQKKKKQFHQSINECARMILD